MHSRRCKHFYRRGIYFLLCACFLVVLLHVKREQVVSAIYINLDQRVDRKEVVEKELGRVNFPFMRLSAVNLSHNAPELMDCWDPDETRVCAGKIGCKLSHVAALDRALDLRARAVAIFEDDFVWSPKVEPKFIPRIIMEVQSHFPNWSVIALSVNPQILIVAQPFMRVLIGQDKYAKVMRIYSAQTTHAYVVKHQYIATLRSNFLACNVERHSDAAIDRCWKTLQRIDEWYTFSPSLGTQAPGFSDIERRNVSYSIM